MSGKIKVLLIRTGLGISLITVGIIIGIVVFAQFGKTESIFDKPPGTLVP